MGAETLNLGDGPLELVIEVPHGATRTADFTALAARLESRLPEGLVDFFHVNTDAGAFELAEAVARHVGRSVAVVRCLVPRTFIDCNRRMDATPEDFKAGKVTPGLMPWITAEADRTLLRGLYDEYRAAVRSALDRLTPAGAVLSMHTYAPRTVDVEVDDQIVPSLRRAYLPEIEPTWPLRPELDVIGRDVDGVQHAPEAVVAALRENLRAIGLTVADSATYPLHPSTLAWDYVTARPGRALCLEIRRDLVAAPFAPFVEMTISPEKVARLAAPIAEALQVWWG